jgi:hypothetical protein
MPAPATTDWKVLEHGPIERLSNNLWRVEGAIPRMSLRRVMTVVRRTDGALVIHSPIALRDRERAELEAWGAPRFLLVPNGYHRLDAPAYKARYPELVVIAPAGSRAKVEEVISVDRSYEQFPSDEVVQLRTLEGVAEVEGVMTVRSADGVTVVLNDIVFNMDRKRDPLGFFFTTLLGSAPGPRVSRLAKWTLVKDKDKLAGELERLAALPDLVRLVVSHEKVASGPAAAQALRQARTYL